MQTRIKEYLKKVAKNKKVPVKVCLLGYGTTNRVILEAIRSSDVKAEITVRQNGKIYDTPPAGVRLICGNGAFDRIDEDVIFASPSVRRERINIPRGTIITSDTELFFGERVENLFLVSGSDGKSTVTTLASLLLSPTFPTLFTGGNIGTPTASASASSGAFLLELSSFNLRYCVPQGGRALLTNVTPNHLDWHADLTEYEECKSRLVKNADEAILSLSCPFNERLASSMSTFALVSLCSTGKELRERYDTKHSVTAEDGMICADGRGILPITSVKRCERHNVENFMSAIALSLDFASDEHILEVAESFNGLEHRCEHFSSLEVDYVNSSIDTTPERTKSTLAGLNRRVNIILGGRGKGLSLAPMKDALLRYADRIAIYGEIAEEICAWLDCDADLSGIPHRSFGTLREAIDYADYHTKSGDTLLLSPAATAYGEFKSFAERGRFFKDYLKEKHTEI